MKLTGEVVSCGRGQIKVYSQYGTVVIKTKDDYALPKGTKVELEVEMKGSSFFLKDLKYDKSGYIISYLQTIKGIGEKTAKKLYEEYGEKILEKIKDKEFLKKVTRGRGEIDESIEGEEELLGLLVSTLGRKRGAKALNFIKKNKINWKENPYRLTGMLGLGFKTVDKFALSFLSKDASCRLEAVAKYVLQKATQKGHLYLEKEEFLSEVEKETGERNFFLPPEIEERDGIVYLKEYYEKEKKIARYFLSRSREAEKIDKIERKTKPEFQLTEEQEYAVELALSSPVSIITGYAGTGKTTVLKEIVKELEARGEDVVLLAPTGKASKRLEEVTGKEAFTIHRGILQDEIIFADTVIVDESSMIDTFLMHWLLKTVGENRRLILVGDVAQLPPVGAGQPFKDLVESNAAPVARLTQIMRNAGAIALNANRVREGRFPEKGKKGSQFRWITEFSEKQLEALLRTAKAKGIEIQLLGAVYDGKLGVNALNKLAQDIYNPDGKEWKGFREGDRVIHTGYNDYDEGVMNGDTGKVVEVEEGVFVAVEFWNGKSKKYYASDLKNLSLAYALTVHKAQGSEYDYGAVVFEKRAYAILSRYWLYTALTRAKKKCFMFADNSATAIAVKNMAYPERKTFLKNFLNGSLPVFEEKEDVSRERKPVQGLLF